MICGRITVRFGALIAFVAMGLGAIATWELKRVSPAPSRLLQTSSAGAKSVHATGAGLFAFGDFGALDLDTLETSAMPWPVIAAVIALAEKQGDAGKVAWSDIVAAFKRFGFL